MKNEVDVLRWAWVKGCVTFLLLSLILTGAGNLRAADVPHKRTVSKKELSKDFFSDPKVRTFQIQIPEEGMASLRRYSRTNVHATVREGERVLTNVAIHLKGMGSFRTVDEKPSLALKFDAFEPKQEYLGLTKLMFNNSVQDPTYMAEMLATRLSRDAGLPAARVTHARVVLNGKDLGLYVVIEAMNKHFLKQHFKSTKGNLYEGYVKDIDSELELDNGAENNQSDVRALLDACLISSPAERWKQVGKVLDIDKFVSFVAMEVLVGHWDGYAIHTNNYRLYHDPGTDKMVFITHGLDWAFRRPNVSIEPPLKSIVGRAVFQTAEGRKLFRERIGFLYTNVFKVEVLTNRMNEALAKLRSAELPPAALAKIERNAGIMRERIELRGKRVEEQLRGIPPPPLKFAEDGFAKLTGWRDESDRGEPIMDQVEHGGRKTLHVLAAGERSRASWRTQVYLPRGRYQFLGMASTQGLVGGSAGLRISGGQRRLGISATAPWRPLSHEFEVTDDGVDVEFVCDFYSMAGEVWFDLDSLRVRRL
jgi:spore coat protein H